MVGKLFGTENLILGRRMKKFFNKYAFDFGRLVSISILIVLYLQTGNQGYINILILFSMFFLFIDVCLLLTSGISLIHVGSKDFSIDSVIIEAHEVDYYIYLTTVNGFYVGAFLVYSMLVMVTLTWFGFFIATSLVFFMLVCFITKMYFNNEIRNFYIRNKEQLCLRK